MKRSLAILFFITVILQPSIGQVNFYFQPEIYGRSIDGLGSFQLQNLTPAAIKGQVSIQVKENVSKSDIVTINIPPMAFGAGINNLPRTAFANASFRFSSNAMAAIVSQTRSFPPGEYTFCFRLINADKGGEDYENCFDAQVQPLVPMSLLNPADKDRICEKRPPLSWLPPVPFTSSMRFRLLLTEKKQGTTAEDLLVNMPLVLLDNISTTTISYPSFAPDLQEGKTYCWQVLAYQQGVVLSRSEIWEFTVQCQEPVKPVENDSYRELKLLMNGNYYIAKGALKFSFYNGYNVKKLGYSIHDIEAGSVKVKNTPDVAIQLGFNKIDINLDELDLKPGKHYLLKVYPFNEPTIEVRFIYNENN
jgi:hypothetical protein